MQKSLAFVVLLTFVALGVEAKSKNKGTAKFTNNGPFFSIPVVVGSQKTKLNVGVDGYYGSSMVYGQGAACDGYDSYCVDHDTFDQTKSGSFVVANPSRSFEFSLGTADGLSGSDDLSLGSLKLKGTMFGVAESVPRYVNRKTKNSGHIAMNAPEKDEDEKTTMQKVVEQAKAPKITFFAPSDSSSQHSVTIGDDNTANCKQNWIKFANQPSVDPKHKPWTIQWSSFKWGSYEKSEKVNVALSPSIDLFSAPRRHANHIYTELNAKYSYDYSGGLVDCDKRRTAPNLEFPMPEGRTIVIKPDQYIKQFDSTHCLLNIYPDELDLWTMPYMFFQGRCVRFDYGAKEVSLAEQK